MVTSLTVADLLRPSARRYAQFYDAALVIGGSLLIGLSAQIAIWLPISPVPVTGQTFAVLMLGALLGARRGSLAVVAYIVEGAVGLPVFAAARAGLPILLGPTGGYLVGFIAAAHITGSLAEKGWDRRIWSTILAMGLGNVAIYACGLFWLSCLAGAAKAVLLGGVYPFIPGDLLKIALAAILLPSGWKLLGCSGLAKNRERGRD
ncbi:MAG: biotin transporter BioY [Phycisphaerales bacterium]|nr:MAG: biotin transporter BioY [Phycisphaerales bacterium]